MMRFKLQYFVAALPARRYFSLSPVVSAVRLDPADNLPVMLNSSYIAVLLRSYKFICNGSDFAVNAGVQLHSGGAGVVPIVGFGAKLHLSLGLTNLVCLCLTAGPPVRNFDCGDQTFPSGRYAVTNAAFFQAFL